MTHGDAARLGRQHGQEQISTVRDCLLFDFQFESSRHWQSYLTGFYRGAGHNGSGNRTMRKQAITASRLGELRYS